jgi:hypothetical protein
MIRPAKPPTKPKHALGRRWVVKGFDGTTQKTTHVFPASSWPEPWIVSLLQRLVCRHLSESDVVDASRTPRDQFYSSVLKEKRHKGKRAIIEVGENPYYVASLLEADEHDD